MKLVLHHFWKDVRLMRGLLALWLAVLVAQVVTAFLSAQPAWFSQNNMHRIDWPAACSVGMTIVWVVVIVWLIQSEPVVGTTSFWRTRPVPRGVFVASKLLFIVLLMVLPSLLSHWFEWALFDVEPAMQWQMMSTLLPIDLLFIVPFIWLGTYTRNLLQFWAAVCGIGLVFFVCALIASNYWTWHSASNGRVAEDIATAVFWTGLPISLILQYGFGRTRMAFVIGAAALGFAMLAIFAGVRPTMAPSARADSHIAFQLSDHNWNDPLMTTGGNVYLNLQLRPAETSPESFAQVESVSGWFKPNHVGWGTALAQTSYGRNLNWKSMLQHENPGLTVLGSDWPGFQSAAFQMPARDARNIKGLTGTLRLQIQGHFMTLVKQAELPLSGSMFARIPNYVVQVDYLNQEGGGINLELHSVGYSQLGLVRNAVFLLVDHKRNIGVMTQNSGTSLSGARGVLGFSDWERVSDSASFGFSPRSFPPDVWAKIRQDQPSDWVLYIYQITPTRTFQSEVTEQNVRL